jgi:hypothetical protein
MFIRRTAATILVDAQLAIDSGSWIVTRTHNPHPAIARLERILASPASDDDVSDAVDALYLVMGQAQMAGDLATAGYEQYELADIHPALAIDEAAPVLATPANDVAPLRRAA